jgi:2,3-bisphosphoglycerate-independent phosphoglycerate mutase
MSPVPKPIVLLILDGWGLAPPGPGNAINLANTPNIDRYWNSSPHTRLEASGEAVGLPHGEDGNTETGHINIGAGQIVYQDLPRINMAIADGSFFQNQALIAAMAHVATYQSTLHLMGLIGAGGVHSNIEHLYALLHLCSMHKLEKVALHLFTDGRDSPPTSALTYVSQVKEKITSSGIGSIASIMGRFYAMDRDQRWERTQKAYLTLTKAEGHMAKSAEQAVNDAYEAGKTDEFIEPTVITNEDGSPKALIQENDAVIFFNFRIDRPRQLTKAFVLPNFETAAEKKPAFDPYAVKYYRRHIAYPQLQSKPFSRGERIKNLFFATMTEYERNLPIAVAFPPQPITMPLGRVLSERSLRQLRIAETEKERFVTYYFNGLREDPFPGEDRIIIPSPKVATYDLYPQMSAPEITETIIERIATGIYHVIIVNYANPDMVAHTGNIKSTITACEVVDECVGKVAEQTMAVGGATLITGDHGNAEELLNPETGAIDTEHSTFPVPFIIIEKSSQGNATMLQSGVLADIAPTMLQLLKVPKPPQMTGHALI